MKNIVWKKPDGTLAITTFAPEVVEAVAEAKKNADLIGEREANLTLVAALTHDAKLGFENISAIADTPMPRDDAELEEQMDRRIKSLKAQANANIEAAQKAANRFNLGNAAVEVMETIGLTPEAHGEILKARAQQAVDDAASRGEFIAPEILDWELVGVDVGLPADRGTRNAWRWDGHAVVVKK